MIEKRTLNDLILKEAEKRGLSDKEHCRLGILSDMTEGVFRSLYNNELPEELTRDLKIITIFPTIKVDTIDSVYTDRIWDPAGTIQKLLPMRDARRNHILGLNKIDVHLEFEGIEFWIWPILRWNDHDAYDHNFQVLSYDSSSCSKTEDFMCRLGDISNWITKENPTLEVYGGCNIALDTSMSWEDLVLDPIVEQATRYDIENWIMAEDRYKKLHIPYRRGYLFEGPPGNGKSSVVRVILKTYPFRAYTINFSNREIEDSDLYRVFRNATQTAPACVLLEDLDRVFPAGGENRTNVTMTALLNALDGVGRSDGVIVIATANNPQELDPAIRLRPGRFDVPVRFDNPDYAQRMGYLQFMFGRVGQGEITEGGLQQCANRTEGLSMAFLRAVFETTAGKAAMSEGSVMTDQQLLEATDLNLKYYSQQRIACERSAGFQSNNSDRSYVKDYFAIEKSREKSG